MLGLASKLHHSLLAGLLGSMLRYSYLHSIVWAPAFSCPGVGMPQKGCLSCSLVPFPSTSEGLLFQPSESLLAVCISSSVCCVVTAAFCPSLSSGVVHCGGVSAAAPACLQDAAVGAPAIAFRTACV